MAAAGPVAACVLVALLLWGLPGLVLARAFGTAPGVRLLLAPALGWAAQTALAHALAVVFGLGGGLALVAAALLCLPALRPGAARKTDWRADWREGLSLAPPALACATLLALVPAVALLPKEAADGAVHLATPIYDHAKVALVDELARAPTVPPANPFFGAGGGAGSLSYYYLWHFGAAQLARLTGASGWEADAAATFFTSFSALALVAGLALKLTPGMGMRRAARAAVPLLALAAAATGNLRPLLAALVGQERLDRLLEPASGLGPLLYEASWSPHHLASATSVVLAVLLLARMRRRAGIAEAGLLAVLAAAAFGSSLWVGGVTLALAMGPVLAVLLATGPDRGRARFLLLAAAAGGVAALICAPLLMAQVAAAAGRGGGLPIRIMAVPVLGQGVPEGLRALLDPLAYWLVLLPLEYPLALAAGLPGLLALLRARRARPETRAEIRALAALAAACLGVGALLVSTAGENNDLGWRAVLPAVLILCACAGGALTAVPSGRRRVGAVALALVFAAGLPDTAALALRNSAGEAGPDGAAFRADPAMWARVRRAVPPEVRLASNPDRLALLTPWPINLSWALLARGRSCFAGRELALAFAPLMPQEREALAELFARVFAGRQREGDLARMHGALGCGAALVTAEDGAFASDPFAASPLYHLVDEDPGRWRLYRARGSAVAP